MSGCCHADYVLCDEWRMGRGNDIGSEHHASPASAQACRTQTARCIIAISVKMKRGKPIPNVSKLHSNIFLNL